MIITHTMEVCRAQQLVTNSQGHNFKHGQKCLFSNLNSFPPIFTKICETVSGHKISVKYDNEQDCMCC